MRIEWTEYAQFDLEQILEFISLENNSAAIDVFHKIRTSVEKLDPMKKMGRVIPELRLHNINIYREIIVSHWRIMYKVEKSKIYILSVLDSRRNIDDALLFRSIYR